MAGRCRPAIGNPHLAAVHARQCGLAEICGSLGRQLLGTEYATIQELIVAITDLDVRPVIVLDALDESLRHQQNLDQLLLLLARARRPDGSPVCRLLVNTRPWDESAPYGPAAAAASRT